MERSGDNRADASRVFDHIMVGLDLTDIDRQLVRYTRLAVELFGARVVSLLHVIQAYDLPDRSHGSLAEIETALAEKVREEGAGLLEDHVGSAAETEVLVRTADRDAAEVIVQVVEEKGIDLLVVGHKVGRDRRATYGRRVAAEVQCDLLVVPERVRAPVRLVLCALDFSEESRPAFERAYLLSRERDVEVVCFYIRDVTDSYFPVSTERSTERILSRARERFAGFARAAGGDPAAMRCRIEIGGELITEGNRIYAAAEEEGADLIMLGAAGDPATETSLLGNAMETLRRIQQDIPVMIVKGR